MTSTWVSITLATAFVLISQAYRLREFGTFGVAMYTGGPALMATVMALMLLVTGTSPWGTTAACATGCAVQWLTDRLRVHREKRREAAESLKHDEKRDLR